MNNDELELAPIFIRINYNCKTCLEKGFSLPIIVWILTQNPLKYLWS